MIPRVRSTSTIVAAATERLLSDGVADGALWAERKATLQTANRFEIRR
jgi:hypothetical protein